MKSMDALCDEVLEQYTPEYWAGIPDQLWLAMDKRSLHAYIEYLYSDLFASRRESTKRMLEIGVWHGASIKLWKRYFHNAKVFGYDQYRSPNADDPDVEFILCNAYSDEFINTIPNKFFDVILDDGSHELKDMIYCVANYLPKLTENGILVIEDIGSIDYIPQMIAAIPQGIRCKTTVYDLRKIKGRFDDIVLAIELL